MISALRRSLDSWIARGFFLIMVVAFIVWGVGDVVRLIGTDTWVAKVAGTTIELPQAQQAFQQQITDMQRRMPSGTDITPEMRRTIAMAAIQGLIGQTTLAQEQRRLGVVVPDSAVRQAVFAIPQFHGPSGQFDQATFQAVLRNNNMTEPQLLEMVRGRLAQQQLLGTLAAGMAPPDLMAKQVFAYQFEQRSADLVELPFSAAPAPPTPTDAVLQRWYDNHPDYYSTKEYRRIKAVVLAPETLAKDIPITDAELHTAYDARKALYVKPERRSVQVVEAPDQAKAAALAAQWRGAEGKPAADWATMQAAAKTAGGSAIQLDDTAQAGLPSAELARAVFNAVPGAISDPMKGLAGWQVVKVTTVTPGTTQTFEQVQDQLHQAVLDSKAADLIYDRANKVDNILASGSGLDELPADLGLAGVAGTMDAEGNTLDGKPAPIPGGDAVRQALVAAAFKANKGDPPQLTEVPLKAGAGSAYYALQVQDVIPPAPKPFAQVKDTVLTDWRLDQQRHTQETIAARLLTDVQHGQTLAQAASGAGLTVTRTPLTGRDQAVAGVPPELLRPLFSLKPGEPTMVEEPEAFVVAVPAEIVVPDPASNPTGYEQVRTALRESLAQDVNEIFTQTLRDQAHPSINQANLDSISGQQSDQ